MILLGLGIMVCGWALACAAGIRKVQLLTSGWRNGNPEPTPDKPPADPVWEKLAADTKRIQAHYMNGGR